MLIEKLQDRLKTYSFSTFSGSLCLCCSPRRTRPNGCDYHFSSSVIKRCVECLPESKAEETPKR